MGTVRFLFINEQFLFGSRPHKGFRPPQAKRDRKAYSLYAAAGNLRRTQIRGKRAIYGWKLINRLGGNIITVRTLGSIAAKDIFIQRAAL